MTNDHTPPTEEELAAMRNRLRHRATCQANPWNDNRDCTCGTIADVHRLIADLRATRAEVDHLRDELADERGEANRSRAEVERLRAEAHRLAQRLTAEGHWHADTPRGMGE